ncbi:surfeit locus protein 2 [Tachyglossus aculeatus]|uniref:surfeit locus protein 2 n=1 Tax=Tachyglossus aculeatus TaxID=9261 RepID=UPI0018F60A9B|nr:surfeit locus protein 2 [Tachyglossus aculeatus]
MADGGPPVPAAVRAFLLRHPALRLDPARGKVRCLLSGHEMPCRLADLQTYTGGAKYRRLAGGAPPAFCYTQFQPHIVPDHHNTHQLFCKLTLRRINKLPEHVLRHVRGRRYRRALQRYEECQKQGVKFVPACLLQKKRRREDQAGGHGQPQREGNFWEPASSDEAGNESDDSMTDLYPPTLFTEKSGAEAGDGRAASLSGGEGGGPAPSGENGDVSGGEKMEVDELAGTKRGKKRPASVTKFKSHHHHKPKSFKRRADVK